MSKDISHFAFCQPRVLPPLTNPCSALAMVVNKKRRHVPESDDEDDDFVPESPNADVLVDETQPDDNPYLDDDMYSSSYYQPDDPELGDSLDSDVAELVAPLDGPHSGSISCPDVHPQLKVPHGFRWRAETDVVMGGEQGRGVNPYSSPSDVYDNDPNNDPKRGPRRWVFTVNNPSIIEAKGVIDFLQTTAHYAIFEPEIGETGTSHLQGYFHLKLQKTRSSIAKLPCFKRAWLAAAKGTEEQCMRYCSKGGLAMEFHPDNYIANAGKRTDLNQAAAAIRDRGHAAIVELAELDPMQYVRYHSGFTALAQLKDRPRDLQSPPNVTIVIGASGSGKSTLVRRLCKEAVASKQAAHLDAGVYDWNHMAFPWFPAIENETIFMCNDFRPIGKGGQIPMVLFCKMWDVDACRVEIKGGHRNLMADTFIMSCIVHPKDWYADSQQEPVKQLLRRITSVIECYVEGGEFKNRLIGNGEAPYGPPLFNMPN